MRAMLARRGAPVAAGLLPSLQAAPVHQHDRGLRRTGRDRARWGGRIRTAGGLRVQ